MALTRRLLLGGAAGAMAGCVPAGAAGTPTSGGGESTMSSPSPSTTPAGPLLRIAAASDLHYGEKGTTYERFADELIERLNATHAATPLDLVVLNGDLAHAARWLDPLRVRLRALAPPLLAVPGNHDEATERQWRELWGHGFDHAVTVNGVRIVCAATSNPAGAYRCAATGVLRRQLDAAAGAPVIVAMHITPVAWTRYGIDCPAVTGLLAGYRNVQAVLNGHDHDEYGVKTRGGVPYLFDAHAGGHWGTGFRGFRVLELHPASIETHVTDGVTIRRRDSLPRRS